MQNYTQEFMALALIHFLAVVAPGPDFTITISQSVRFGRRTGLFTALGIGAGISIHVLYTLLGVGALMHSAAWLLMLAKVAGSGYLLYLGVRLLRAAPRQVGEMAMVTGAASQSPRQAFSMGFLTNAMNPKATLFFLSIFTTVVSASTPLAIQAGYGVWMCLVNAAWFALVSMLFSSEAVRRSFIRLGHWFERLMGLVLVIFAARLVLSL